MSGDNPVDATINESIISDHALDHAKVNPSSMEATSGDAAVDSVSDNTNGIESLSDRFPSQQSLEMLRKRSVKANLRKNSKTRGSLQLAEGTTGKTHAGKTFRVPETTDMVTSLFSPTQKKSAWDLFILSSLAFQVLLYLMLPSTIRRYTFLVHFIFWRGSYNIGIGVLLKWQSEKKWLVHLCKRYDIFGRTESIVDEDDNEEEISSKFVMLKRLIRKELVGKMGNDYSFEDVPIEYNTWLLFRQIVDLILMNDFFSYCLFAISWISFPPEHSTLLHIARWIVGTVLILFNIWVKLDAHRVIKDFAWYWGDFFFLIEQSLVFDGVFEMAPHPMYSIGYAGYYGISLMSGSYTVLFCSLLAHAAQFAFLTLVENPHIEKTYGSPKFLGPHIPIDNTERWRRSRSNSSTSLDIDFADKSNLAPSPLAVHHAYFSRDLIIFHNFDAFRASDVMLALIVIYSTIIPVIVYSPPTSLISRALKFLLVSYSIRVKHETMVTAFLVANSFFWRIFHSGVLGYVLHQQSKRKRWTGHFIKHGGSVRDAFQSWKSMYNLSLCMTYVSFFAAAYRLYRMPTNWTYGFELLRHTLALLLIALHIWTSVSEFEVLGDFGWFYGDFFLDDYPASLQYTGIYRYINNPEATLGNGAFWGMVLVCNSRIILIMAVIAQFCNYLFVKLVEGPHMNKLYGASVRKEAGIAKTIKNAKFVKNARDIAATQEGPRELVRVVREVAGTVEKASKEAAEAVEEFIEKSKPKFKGVVDDTKLLLSQSRERLIISRVAVNISGIDITKYSLSFVDKTGNPVRAEMTASRDPKPIITFSLGEPIIIKWTAPRNHSKRDWVGIYKVTSNASTEVTKVSSVGKWLPVYEDAYDGDEPIRRGDTSSLDSYSEHENSEIDIEDGVLVFYDEKLPWTVGSYEVRYHHDNKYNVMARTQAFEVVLPSIPENGTILQTEEYLLPYVQRCLMTKESEHEATDIPQIPSDPILVARDQQAKRIVYGIKMMFGVDFAWQVVTIDGRVEKLARRIHTAKKAMAPFSALESSK